MKGKPIRKDKLRRVESDYPHPLQGYALEDDMPIQTKVKRMTTLEEEAHETDKKVNKRLVFG